MESKKTIGSGLAIPIILGVFFMIFGLATAFYGVILYSDESNLGVQSGSPYADPFLTLIPEFVLVCAACFFILGILVLYYATESRRPPAMPR